MKKNLATIYIVRHGETEWNAKGLLQGQGDSLLTAAGIKQAENLAKKLKNILFDVILSSDLLRAKRTAEIIAQEKKIAVKTARALRERSFGRFEGKSIDEFREELQADFAQYEKLADEQKFKYKFLTEPKIHSDEELMQRFIPFLREVAVAYTGKKVLIVTHGGVMRSFLVRLGYGTSTELTWGTVQNSAYIKLLSDGLDFFLKEVVGVKKKTSLPV